MNSLFDLFDLFNFDFSEVKKKFDEAKENAEKKKDAILHKYDLNTQEGYEAFINDAAELRKDLMSGDYWYSNKLVSLLDSIVESVMKKHNEKKEVEVEDKKNELVHAEVVRNVTENGGKLNVVDKKEDTSEDKEVDFEWPSNNLTPKQKRSIWRLVDEYVDTMIIPYLDEDYDQDLVDDMSSGLFEFAAWVLTKKED